MPDIDKKRECNDTLAELVSFANVSGNRLTREQIRLYFKDIVDDEEKICCYLVSIGSFTKCVEKIKQEIACVLGSLYSIDYFIQMRELPKNLNGKIDSARLRQYSDNVIKNGEQYDY